MVSSANDDRDDGDDDAKSPLPSGAASASSAAEMEASERLQGERFLQLSQRCHEQNWRRVHELAEQIVLHKRLMKEAAAERKKAAAAKAKSDGDTHGNEKVEGMMKVEEEEKGGCTPDHSTGEGVICIGSSGIRGKNHGNSNISSDARTGDGRNEASSTPTTKPPVPPASPAMITTPRMLSTCLGTASPLAWTCRYSAPSLTVKLVLDLDLSAVRRCLPQLGTPLHEIVGRPRPLRKLPLKRGRWNKALIEGTTQGGDDDDSRKKPADATDEDGGHNKGSASKEKRKRKKSKKKRTRAPRILRGLHEWRRTVRTLIAADETLLKADMRLAALEPAVEEESTKKPSPEWRQGVETMIRDNVTNINKVKGTATGGVSKTVERKPILKSSSNGAQPNQGLVRATLAQDADGNTPLHFMIRGAASPAFGGGRWHSSRHDVDDDYSDDDTDENNDANDDDDDRDGTGGDAMDVDSSAGEETSSAAQRSSRSNNRGNLRPVEYSSSSAWDGVRWCMEAHLRRVERRMARKLRSPSVESSDGEVTGGVASVRITNGSPSIFEEMGGGNGDELKLPAKRKSAQYSNIDVGEGVVKTVRRGYVSSGGLDPSPSQPNTKSDKEGSSSNDSQVETGHKEIPNSPLRKKKRPPKYLNADEYQDCCYDPLLGAVRDLVYACPQASGVPDHREYEETPLIVALKSSIYVVMEPAPTHHDENHNVFQLVQAQQQQAAVAGEAGDGGNNANNANGGGDNNAGDEQEGVILPGDLDVEEVLGEGQPAGGGNAGVGEGFAIFGNPGPGGGDVNGIIGLGGGGAAPGGALPFPELGALLHNRPFHFFPDDEAMMAVLRGHGRRVNRNGTALSRRKRRSATANNLPASTSPATDVVGGGGSDSNGDDSDSSSVSDDSSYGDGDSRNDAFIPTSREQLFSIDGPDPPSVQLGLLPRRRPRYDYQTAFEYRIFMLVRIMLDAYPRAACLMISDYTPLHSAVFHGRCPDTIRLLLDAEARFRSESAIEEPQPDPPLGCPRSTREPPPTLRGPAMLCTNTRGELPLHFACMRNECARNIGLLAEADPRAALVRDASGRTPLRWLWIRFVDGLLDRFGGRDTQREDDLREDQNVAFDEQEVQFTGSFSSLGGRTVKAGMARGKGNERSPMDLDDMFVFDTEYIRRTRTIDRTVDYLRMRHVPSGFENIEYVAAEHAIMVLLKLKYLQHLRIQQLEAYHSSAGGQMPPNVSMSTKEEFILYAFEKFTALIHAALVASDAEERMSVMVDGAGEDIVEDCREAKGNAAKKTETRRMKDQPNCARQMLWHSLPHEEESNKKFFLVHEACGSPRASCPAAVAKICIRLFSDQLSQRDDDGRLPLHRVACRGIGWEPPGSDADASQVSLADETLTLLKDVLSESHEMAATTYDNNMQLPLHCAVDSIVTSLVMGKQRRAHLHAEARVALQKYRHTHVQIAIDCFNELIQANSSALQSRDGKTGLFPFMQAATPHIYSKVVEKYTSDLSRRPGFDVGVGFHSLESEVVEEDDAEAECDHVTIIYHLLRGDPSVINGLL